MTTICKDTQRALVRYGYRGDVIKQFRGSDAVARFQNEVRILKFLEAQGCDFVPRLIEERTGELTIIMTHCGAVVERLSDSRVREIFDELLRFGVRHDDPYLRNITYRAGDGRFCVIDFEFAEQVELPETPSANHVAGDSGVPQLAQSVEANLDSLESLLQRSADPGWECVLPEQVV